MAQTTILAAGTTAASSTDLVLTKDDVKLIGLFATGDLPSVLVQVMVDTPGDDLQIGLLSRGTPVMVLSGPGTFRLKRPVVPSAVGIYTEG